MRNLFKIQRAAGSGFPRVPPMNINFLIPLTIKRSNLQICHHHRRRNARDCIIDHRARSRTPPPPPLFSFPRINDRILVACCVVDSEYARNARGITRSGRIRSDHKRRFGNTRLNREREREREGGGERLSARSKFHVRTVRGSSHVSRLNNNRFLDPANASRGHPPHPPLPPRLSFPPSPVSPEGKSNRLWERDSIPRAFNPAGSPAKHQYDARI
jgi:hypothetical protein